MRYCIRSFLALHAKATDAYLRITDPPAELQHVREQLRSAAKSLAGTIQALDADLNFRAVVGQASSLNVPNMARTCRKQLTSIRQTVDAIQ